MPLTLLSLKALAPPFSVGVGVNVPPVADFSWEVVGYSGGIEVDFVDESSDADGAVLSWEWDFGDGATSAERHPSHTYAAAGVYAVTLSVVDDQGIPGFVGHAVTLVGPQAPYSGTLTVSANAHSLTIGDA